MDLTRTLDKASVPNKTTVQKQERYFELSVPALVSGANAKGEEFEERTKISSISSQEASFWLKVKVTIGTRINLCLQIPKTLILESHLNLLISGEVVFVQTETDSRKKQLVIIRLDRSYKIQNTS
ncbi:MAG: hypothetical protein GQ545_01640 [Candidatus Aminicenantes bacterium]|nr:hypothetical protein [Candidatus Aminicenantes bacterium]